MIQSLLDTRQSKQKRFIDSIRIGVLTGRKNSRRYAMSVYRNSLPHAIFIFRKGMLSMNRLPNPRLKNGSKNKFGEQHSPTAAAKRKSPGYICTPLLAVCIMLNRPLTPDKLKKENCFGRRLIIVQKAKETQ